MYLRDDTTGDEDELGHFLLGSFLSSKGDFSRVSKRFFSGNRQDGGAKNVDGRSEEVL